MSVWFIEDSLLVLNRQIHINAAWFPQLFLKLFCCRHNISEKTIKSKDDANVVEMENTLENPLILEWQNSSDCPDEGLIENDLSRKIR